MAIAGGTNLDTKEKYSINQYSIETILAWAKSGEIAIPEIQRPFVWNSTKVRDFIDSLYQGYPVGYLIAWSSPGARTKDGSTAEGKKILIDGQQRVTALTTAILGSQIIDKNYRQTRIQIAFHPIKKRFEVFNPAIAKDKAWIPDIAPIVRGDIGLLRFIDEYCAANTETDKYAIEDTIQKLSHVVRKQIGLIELTSNLEIETVTEIFIRINSQGVVLSQADFAMSKIAANEKYKGSLIRKSIDYFCHMARYPELYNQIKECDKEFTKTDAFQKMSWLKKENDDLYDPDYSDLLRVAFTTEFNRGKLSDLVNLLSGRNFETRSYEDEIARKSFAKLKKGINSFINETNFKRFLMIIKSAGFISANLIRSQNALNFAYVIYLKLRAQKYNPAEIERYARRWFVLSILTGRYSASPESMFDQDIRNISKKKFAKYLEFNEEAELSDAFWNTALVQSLDSSVASSPYFNVFLAAQVKANNKGFLSRDISVKDLITHRGDIHHIFPRGYLKKNGLEKNQYNQIANYVYMQSEININIGNKAPVDYFKEIKQQCKSGKLKYGGIDDLKILKQNLRMNCVPDSIENMTVKNYDEFLEERRKLIAKKMKRYYFSL